MQSLTKKSLNLKLKIKNLRVSHLLSEVPPQKINAAPLRDRIRFPEVRTFYLIRKHNASCRPPKYVHLDECVFAEIK